MGPARLLAEREDHASQYRRGECAAGQARAPAEQHEIKRHQRESGGGVGSRKAAGARQLVRAVAEQGDVRPAAAVSLEVARAIDIGDLLQSPDHGRAQRERRGDEYRLAPKRPQAPNAASRDRRDDRGQADDPDKPAATRVDEIHRPPGLRADPGPGGRIVEEGVCDGEVDAPGNRERAGEQQAGHEDPPDPGSRRSSR
jgi:hypothetical protein